MVALPCDGVQCFNGGSCSNLDEEKFKCSCVEGFEGDYCEKEKVPDPCDGVQCLNGGNCTNLEAGKFKCNCVPGFEGEKCEKEARYYTCKDFYSKGKATENKAYSLAIGLTDKISVYCHMTELGACGGGGWTLVMKTDGNKDTFGYDSDLWTSNKYHNLAGGATGLDLNETKLPMYHRTPFTKICLGMKVNGKFNFIVLNKAANSLYTLISDGQYRETDLGRSTWKKLIGSTASLQYNCNKEGFNAVCGGSSRVRARIGILANNERNCVGCDSRIGFGTQKTRGDSNTCGNVQTYHGDNGNRLTQAMGYILVQ